MTVRLLQIGWLVWEGKANRIAMSEHSKYYDEDYPE